MKDDILVLQMSQIETLPVTSSELRQETWRNKESSSLLEAVRKGQNLQGKEAHYTIEDEYIMYA